jgi:hypothetical protein
MALSELAEGFNVSTAGDSEVMCLAVEVILVD